MQILGNRNIKHTLIYTKLVGYKDDEYTAKVAHSEEEVCQLVEAGFEYICDHDGNKISQETQVRCHPRCKTMPVHPMEKTMRMCPKKAGMGIEPTYNGDISSTLLFCCSKTASLSSACLVNGMTSTRIQLLFLVIQEILHPAFSIVRIAKDKSSKR